MAAGHSVPKPGAINREDNSGSNTSPQQQHKIFEVTVRQ